MMRLGWAWTVGLVVVALARPAVAQDEDDEFQDADNVAVATRLFRDGFHDRAEAVLSTVDPADEAVDAQQYWRLRGLVASKLAKYVEAADYFTRGIRAGDREPRVYLLLAQAYGQAEAWEKAAVTLRLAPKAVKEQVEAYLLESTAFVKIEKKGEAYKTLTEAQAKFPDERKVERQRIFLLVEMGLYQQAIEEARAFFSHANVGVEDRIALAQALRNGGQIERAILVLEEALLRHPENQDVRRELAATYNFAERYFTSAEVLRPVAWLEPEWRVRPQSSTTRPTDSKTRR
ncbi:MAG: tetratricopeptide repeat protein [Myxococcales bacterium]|nr:tetratricopeptide repeat protein [Myxococcales bacterium]